MVDGGTLLNHPRKAMSKLESYTHYSYIPGPNGYRQPEDFFDLDCAGLKARRRLVHELLNVGRCLATLPPRFQLQPDRDDLEEFLNG